MALEKYRGKKPGEGDLAVVVGAGRSGLAAARLLRRNGVKTRLLDKNPEALDPQKKSELVASGVDVRFGPHEPFQFAGADYIIPSPGMPISSLDQYLEGQSPSIISELELGWRYLRGEPVLAVTGTSGKTTTASLAAAMLKAQGLTVFLGGNIGTPVCEYLLADRRADVLVLETSSFQLQGCSTFCPRVGVLLNISPNHLDYHEDMDEYVDAKFRIFRCQDEGDLALIGPNLDEWTHGRAIPGRRQIIDEQGRFPEMRLLGKHNAFNAEAAWQAARFFGTTLENATHAATNFQPLPHRLETVAEKNGVIYVNDSKCTTPAALKVALEAFDRPIRLLCGGKFKGGDLEALAPLVMEKVKEVALFGASREVFEKAWANAAPMTWHPDLRSAVFALSNNASAGEAILLAPATSSFDLYKNYMDRGDDFRALVKELK